MSNQPNIVHLKELIGQTDAEILLIVGPPGAGQEEFAMQYILDGFSEKNNGIYVTTDAFPNDIIKKMKQLGVDPSTYLSSKQLQFIDSFSYRTGEIVDINKLQVDNIRDLTGLSVIIKQMIDTKDKLRLVIDTISTISIYNTDIALLDFIQMQVARLKQKNHSGLIIAYEGMMSEKVIQGIKAFVDGVIEFKPQEDVNGILTRRLRILFASTIMKSGWINLYR